jgi:hypothetical protein
LLIGHLQAVRTGVICFIALIRHCGIIPHDFSVSFFANIVTSGLMLLLMLERGGEDKIMLSSSKH